MRKLILIVAFMLLSVQNCFAAEIHEDFFNGNEKLRYPVVKICDSEIENKINDAIRDEILRYIKEIHYASQYNGAEVVEMHINYEIPCNQAGNTVILSILLTESSYFKGAAHPSTYLHALNFNLGNGELIDKSYLLDVGSGVPESHFIELLDQKLREKAEFDKLYLFPESLPLKNLPDNFYWDENLHLHFIFQQYEVAPYAMGIIDVDIDA